MGSWCETDGITQLPINAGDKVRLFILTSNTHFHQELPPVDGAGCSYSSTYWAPVGPAIQGTYDDYGRVEDIIDNKDSQLVWSYLKSKNVVSIEHDDGISEKKIVNSLEEAIRLTERGNTQISGYFRPATLGMFFVLEEVYQAILKFNPVEAHHYKQGSYLYRPLQEIIKYDIQSWYTDVLVKLTANNIPLWDLAIDLSGERVFGYSIESDTGCRVFKDEFLSLAKQHVPFEDERVQSLVHSTQDLILVNRVMSSARKMWQPQTGKGSQDNDLEIHKIISQSVLDISAARTKRHEEEWEVPPRDEEGYTDWMREHNLKTEQENVKS